MDSREVTATEQRVSQLRTLVQLDPDQLLPLAMGQWPEALAVALRRAVRGTWPSQARVTAWGIEVLTAGASYWAARHRYLSRTVLSAWTGAPWLPGASQLRDMARAAMALWGEPARSLDTAPAPLRAAVTAATIAQSAKAVFTPWAVDDVAAWWRALEQAGPASQQIGWAWLWVTPVALCTRAASHASWGLTHALAGCPGWDCTSSGDGGAGDSDSTASRGAQHRWNPLAWLAGTSPSSKTHTAAAKWRTAPRPGKPENKQWWNAMVRAWGGPEQLLAAPGTASPAGQVPAAATPCQAASRQYLRAQTS